MASVFTCLRCPSLRGPLSLPAESTVVACTKDPRDWLLQASVVLAFAPRVCLGFVPSILFPSVVGSVRFVNGFSCLQISVLMD